MLILVSGGAGSGKSAFAEALIAASAAEPRIYLATMRVWDSEDAGRVLRHRALRAGKDFVTVECPVALSAAEVPAGCAVLLEDLSNLTANEWFGGARDGAAHRILEGVRRLQARAELAVVVSNELFSDGIRYDGETAEYLRLLALLNRTIAALADQVYESVCGIPICWKGGGR